MEISVPVGCNGIFSPWNRMRTLNSTGFPLGFREAARRSSRSLEKFGTQDPHQKERDLSAVGPGPPEPAFLAKSHLFITANRAPVGRKDPEVDTGEPQRRKSVAHKGAYRVGAEALIPVGLLAYANAELRVARSEERRVGKESGSLCGREDVRKKRRALTGTLGTLAG